MVATKEDLDAVIKEETANSLVIVKAMGDGFARIEALIVNGGTPADFQAEVDSLKAANDVLLAGIEKANAEGVPATPPPPPAA